MQLRIAIRPAWQVRLAVEACIRTGATAYLNTQGRACRETSTVIVISWLGVGSCAALGVACRAGSLRSDGVRTRAEIEVADFVRETDVEGMGRPGGNGFL